MDNMACNTIHEAYRLGCILLPIPGLFMGWDYAIA